MSADEELAPLLWKDWKRLAIVAWVGNPDRRDAIHRQYEWEANAMEDWPELVWRLHLLGADVNATPRQSSMTPMMYAIQFDMPETLYILLRLGAVPYGNGRDGRRWDPLRFALQNDYRSCVKVLLDRGITTLSTEPGTYDLPGWCQDFLLARHRALRASVALFKALRGKGCDPRLAAHVARGVWDERFRDEAIWKNMVESWADWPIFPVYTGCAIL